MVGLLENLYHFLIGDWCKVLEKISDSQKPVWSVEANDVIRLVPQLAYRVGRSYGSSNYDFLRRLSANRSHRRDHRRASSDSIIHNNHNSSSRVASWTRFSVKSPPLSKKFQLSCFLLLEV